MLIKASGGRVAWRQGRSGHQNRPYNQQMFAWTKMLAGSVVEETWASCKSWEIFTWAHIISIFLLCVELCSACRLLLGKELVKQIRSKQIGSLICKYTKLNTSNDVSLNPQIWPRKPAMAIACNHQIRLGSEGNPGTPGTACVKKKFSSRCNRNITLNNIRA